MYKRILFSLLFIVTIIGGFYITNQHNSAKAVNGEWACVWKNSGHIDCHKAGDVVQGLTSLLQTATDIGFTIGGGAILDVTGISGWAADGVKNWQESVLQSYDSVPCIGPDAVGGSCHGFYYAPETSKNNGYPTYCNVNGSGDVTGEGCLHFVNLNPLTTYHTGGQGKVTGVPADSNDWWAIGEITAASDDPGNDECGYTRPTNCTRHNGTEYTGDALNTDAFKANVDAIQALDALKEACEREAPLSFITCPIYTGITGAISQLIGGQGTNGVREGLLIDFLTITPLTSDSGQNIMQAFVQQVVNIANFIYIVVFLLLIFSSSLPLGLDNYTIKKMLPKFIAAVILTQFSFVICQAVIDIFNLLGTVVPNIIFALQLNTAAPSSGTTGGSLIGTGLNSLILGGFATGALGFLATGGWIILIVLAFIALIAVLVGFVYMVLRVLVIYILVILSPIAFVAWVLPGTEKFFFNWWKNFIKVNAMFPVITGMLAIAIVLGNVLIASNTTSGALKLVGMLIPIVALFMIPKTLKWTTQGMNTLAAGVLGATAGKLGAGASAVGKGAKAGGKYAKSAGKDAANDYRTKKAGEAFGRGNKAGGALLMGKLPTAKGTHQAREAASKAEREVAERNQASLSAAGNSLQGLQGVDLFNQGDIEARLVQRGVRADKAAAQARLIHDRAVMHNVNNGAELYNQELKQVAMGQGSQILGVSQGDRSMQVASVTEMAKLGDFQSIYEAQQATDANGNALLTQDTLMKGIDPHIGDVMTKAPDIVKGSGPAFDAIGAEKIAQLDKKTAARYAQYVSSQPANSAAHQNLRRAALQFKQDPRLASMLDPTARQTLNDAKFNGTNTNILNTKL